jgi:small-conductance mechanosensitive channel
MDFISEIYQQAAPHLFSMVGKAALGFAIFVGGFIVQALQAVILLPLLTCFAPKHEADEHGTHYKKTDGDLEKGIGAVAIGEVRRMGYPGHREKTDTTWHGHARHPYQSWAFLAVLILRVLTVVAATFFAFHVAGINFFSLAVSMGIVASTFAYGAGDLVHNTFAAITIHSTDIVEQGDFIHISNYMGEVVNMGVQHTVIFNPYDVHMGRRITRIPNKMFISFPFDTYPDGPPPIVTEAHERSKSVKGTIYRHEKGKEEQQEAAPVQHVIHVHMNGDEIKKQVFT